jgi:hypothetical protein
MEKPDEKSCNRDCARGHTRDCADHRRAGIGAAWTIPIGARDKARASMADSK